MFIAVAIMSVLLLVTYAVAQIAIKSTQFATSGRDSQFAFFAADAGIECALYWDTRYEPSKFATSTSGSPIACGGFSIASGQAIPGTTTSTLIGGGGNANPTSVVYFSMNQGGNPVPHCAIVSITKLTNGSTYIKSRGYNTCDASNPRRVERGIEVTY